MHEPIRVLTWNVWWRFGPWQQRQPALVDTIAQARPDVLTLQESWATADERQIDRFAAAAGLAHTAFSAFRPGTRWQSRIEDGTGVEVGVAIASRWPLTRVRDEVLPTGTGPAEGRTCLAAVVEHPDGPLPVVTTHLTSHPTDSATRSLQLDAVAQVAHDLRRAAGGTDQMPWPLVVTGDLNARPDSDPVRRFGGVLAAPAIDRFGFVDSWEVVCPDDPGHTWVGRNGHVVDWVPQVRIDYVFLGLEDFGRRGLPRSARLVGDGPAGGVWPSDHLGIAVDLIRP